MEIFTIIIDETTAVSFTTAIMAARKLERYLGQPMVSMDEKLAIADIIHDLETASTVFPLIRKVGEKTVKIYKSPVEIRVYAFAQLY